MIKVTIGDITNSVAVFNKITKESFSGSGAFKIARLIRELSKENDSYLATRLDIINKYADKDDNGETIVTDGTVHISPERMDECTNELTELLKTEVELSVDLLELEYFDNTTITPDEAQALLPFIK